jgi:hypothetical protein
VPAQRDNADRCGLASVEVPIAMLSYHAGEAIQRVGIGGGPCVQSLERC